MATHRAQGQAVVYVEDGHIVAAKGDLVQTIALADIPLTMGGMPLVFRLKTSWHRWLQPGRWGWTGTPFKAGLAYLFQRL
jgi:hypothetical protein